MDRIALVIGNSNYLNVPKLNNPKNDANDIECVLQKLNFDVIKILDARLMDIQNAINDFLQRLDEYAVGLLFYAGHGMQIDGKNYIVPVDCQICDKGRTTVSCYCLNAFLDGVSAYKGKTIICILDACRNNPFVISRGLGTGFKSFDNQPKGTIIAYSTSADCTAFDGQNSNGLYTQVLKDALIIPNLKIEEMFKSVRNKVSEISINQYGDEQLSWEYSSLVGDFYFSVTPQPVNLKVTDEEIYKFITKRFECYESKAESIYDAECLPYVDAYNEFHIPIIKLLRAYSRIDYPKKGVHFSDATIDQMNYSYLTSWGFEQKYGRWYYKDNYVEMGDLLPLPDDLMPLDPEQGKEVKIDASVTVEELNGKLRFRLYSNIPEGTPLVFSVDGNQYFAQSQVIAGDTDTFSEWFGNKDKPIKKGFYKIKITCPIDRLLPPEIQRIFGERNRNINGRFVCFDPIVGNTILVSCILMIKDNHYQILDMGQKILD